MNWNGSFRHLQVALLCLALVATSACNRKPAGNATPFPDSNEVPGWAKTGGIRTFEAADLWQYIDGEAERYLKAGVQRVSTADYKLQNKTDVVVDVYTMENPEGAAKIFESEPGGDAKTVELGDAARLYGQSLVFRKGTALVRIVAYEGSPDLPQAMLQLGQKIDKKLTK